MFEQLTRLPLFQGANKDQIVSIIEKMPMHFVKYAAGDTVVERGQRCEHVRFVVSGSVSVSLSHPSHKLKVTYSLAAPDVVGPEYLFGINNSYPYDIIAGAEGCGLLQLSKRDFLTMIYSDRIFMFNILNMLSSLAQRSMAPFTTDSPKTTSTRQRLMTTLAALAPTSATDVTVDFNISGLQWLVGMSRSTIGIVLEQLSADGAIEYSPGHIKIIKNNTI